MNGFKGIEKNETIKVVTFDGETITGNVIRKTRTHIEIADATSDVADWRIAFDDIKSLRKVRSPR